MDFEEPAPVKMMSLLPFILPTITPVAWLKNDLNQVKFSHFVSLNSRFMGIILHIKLLGYIKCRK
jgi:hypothetical protein